MKLSYTNATFTLTGKNIKIESHDSKVRNIPSGKKRP